MDGSPPVLLAWWTFSAVLFLLDLIIFAFHA